MDVHKDLESLELKGLERKLACEILMEWLREQIKQDRVPQEKETLRGFANLLRETYRLKSTIFQSAATNAITAFLCTHTWRADHHHYRQPRSYNYWQLREDGRANGRWDCLYDDCTHKPVEGKDYATFHSFLDHLRKYHGFRGKSANLEFEDLRKYRVPN
ncbi:hypothetical protein F4780DRAFT_778386 [Xylariomycetidae sp. FL0641]|nr:hypothetical protein F4780DRAFT_778386 [Xylariomycetidae sp. FL0641]